MGRSLSAIALLVLAALLAACGSERLVAERDGIIVERRPDRVYDRLFPAYVELCATSQFRPKDGSLGGVPGHAVMYLKGACKDEEAPYPRLRRCRRIATDPYDSEHGAGVSVNRWLRNTNWIAIPGNALFYAGNLAPGARLTRAHFDATVQQALALGIFDGVELHERPGRTGEGLEAFIARSSLGTDFALQFARTVFCARVPVTEEMLGEVIDFLNDLNHEFVTGEVDYEWSGFSDNCMHTLRNAMAAASIWTPLSVRAVKLRQIFNLAIPANEFVNLALLTTEGPIDDYGAIYSDPPQLGALMDFGWLPTRHGALVKTLPVHEENDLYETAMRLFVLQSPFRRGAMRETLRLLSDPRFVDLEANLRHFTEKYDAILASRGTASSGLASLRGDRYRRVRRRYEAYIEAQRGEVEGMLERLPALETRAEGS